MLVTVIGLGLIGGSLALELKKRMGYEIQGIDLNIEHTKKALELGIVDKIIDLKDIKTSDIVVLAVPVNHLPNLAITVLNSIKNDTIVFDMGSTKEKLCKTLENHEKRSNFVAVHPIAGTEYLGPEVVVLNLFDHKVNIICDKQLSSKKAVDRVLNIFDTLQMRTIFMDSST